jgi:hypothetical protein
MDGLFQENVQGLCQISLGYLALQTALHLEIFDRRYLTV